MVTSLLERRETTAYEAVPEDCFLVPLLLLAGDPDDDGSEPHICRGID
ncbi:hypothetical protein [Streptomyces sp. NPDC000229]